MPADRCPSSCRSRGPVAVAWLLALVALVAPVAASTGCSARGEAQSAARTQSAAASTPAVPTTHDPRRTARERAVTVLSEWDERRSAALASGDAEALRRLYVAASPLAVQDLRLLQRYQDRGLRLTAVSQQVASVKVRVSSPRVVEVGVVERLAVARVRPSGAGAEPRPLATTRWARRELRLVRVGGTWRLSSARAG